MAHDDDKKMTTGQTVMALIWIAFFFWAVIIAYRSFPPGPQRTLHMVLSMIAPPAYLIAHYVGG